MPRMLGKCASWVFSEIVPGSAAVQVLQGPEPDGIIVTGMVSPRLDELLSKLSVPMLQLGEEFPPIPGWTLFVGGLRQ